MVFTTPHKYVSAKVSHALRCLSFIARNECALMCVFMFASAICDCVVFVCVVTSGNEVNSNMINYVIVIDYTPELGFGTAFQVVVIFSSCRVAPTSALPYIYRERLADVFAPLAISICVTVHAYFLCVRDTVSTTSIGTYVPTPN